MSQERRVHSMKDQVVLRVTCKMLFPFIIIFAVYVITHGEIGPGGGFQGGVILAAAFIFYGLVFGVNELLKRIPQGLIDAGMALGVLLYAGTGLATVFRGGAFLDYSMINPGHPGDAEAIGMTLVEYGVGITVTCVMINVYVQITERARGRSDRAEEGELV